MKAKTQFICNGCGKIHSRWSGKCDGCNEWNTITEQVASAATSSGESKNRYSWANTGGKLVKLSQVTESTYDREPTGLSELDRVLGGGVVRGSVNLIGGDPGIGKSTLLTQLLGNLGMRMPVLYVTGEESEGQTRMRANRLGVSDEANISLATETELEKILVNIQECEAQFVVIDSIQTMFTGALSAAPGTISQVRECAAQLTRVAKTTGITICIIGHVTKEGELAGPRVLEHIVDSVLYFEGEEGSSFRMLRGIKNRFGSVNELGVFSMEERGLVDVSNPSSMFLTNHEAPVVGSCITVAMEGNRPFLVEIQALVERSLAPNPKRASSGIEVNRVNLMLAVLARHMGVDASEFNVYVKVVGGIRLLEPAADFALLVALYSSLKNVKIPLGVCVFGEAGLVGEARAVTNPDARLKEAQKLGFKHAIYPKRCESKKPPKGIGLHQVNRVEELGALLKQLN